MRLSLILALAFVLHGAEPQSTIDKTCVGCHQGANGPAGLDLRSLAFRLDDPHAFGWWVRVHDAVEKGIMPPGGKAALDDAGRAAFLAAIARPMIAHEQKRASEQGRSMLRRLNRYEYESTVRELLSAPWLRLRQSLPEDGVIARFNKVGQGLDVSHVQMSRYLDTGEQALRLVVEAAGVRSKTVRLYAREQRSMISRMKYSPFNNHPERATIPILGLDAQPEVIAEKAPMTVAATRELEGFATTASTYIGNEYRWRPGFSASLVTLRSTVRRVGSGRLGFDRRRHVGLHLHGAQRAAVDAHLVDAADEVLPIERVAADRQRARRGGDLREHRPARDLHAVHVEA